MKQTLILCVTLIVIVFLWHSPISYPLKILVVFFHESSHALMTLITGGQVKEMAINQNLGGHVLSVGGDRFLTLTAGYLGSLVWGIVIYLLATITHYDRAIMGVLGATVLLIAAIFCRNLFALIFSLIGGLSMLLISVKGSRLLNDLTLKIIGLTNMLYVPLDIYSDTIARSELRSDARMLAEEFAGTTLFWGGLWLFISLVAVYFTIKISIKYHFEENTKSQQ